MTPQESRPPEPYEAPRADDLDPHEPTHKAASMIEPASPPSDAT